MPITKNWAGKALVGLGAISYSLYLTHVPVGGRVVNLGRRFVNEPSGEALLSALALAVSVLFAVFFWNAIERGSINCAARLANRIAKQRAVS